MAEERRGPLSYHALPCRIARDVRRRWRRMRRSWSLQGYRFVYHPVYEQSLHSVPLDARRAERVLAFLAEEGLVERADLARPRTPSLRTLLRVHDHRYLESLQRPDVLERIFGVPVSDEDAERVVEMQRMMVGGTAYATRLALSNRGVAVNLGGGMHHAYRDSGLAFCLFNDLAVAITCQRARGFKGRVLVVDLDLHDGNGTRSIFAHDPTVHTFSVHNEHWGDTEAVASTSIALGDDVGDEVYLGTLLKTLPDVVHEVDPALVFYVAGTDPAMDDPLGNWQISADGMLRRDQLVVDLVRRRRRPLPLVVVLGGGYGDRSWRYSARFVAWMMTGRRVEPPQNEELTLRRLRRLAGSIDQASLTSDPGDYRLSLTEDDLVGILPGAPRPTRFLRYFSRHGVELLLERFGILDDLRVRGFEHPTVELDLSPSVGQTVRVFSSPDREHLLIELRAERSTRAVDGCEVLVIEWLLMQNPRAEFGPYRRPLPGQQHPGLGMLKDILGWLVVVSEILELDGIYYAPSTYHVAAQSRSVVRFLHPRHEARFRALEELLVGMTLAEASRRVEDGEVIDDATGEPLEWEAWPMVLPESDRLRDRVYGERYEAEVEEERARCSYRLGTPEPVGSG